MAMSPEPPAAPHPDALALGHMVDKNLWLVRMRWVYPVFIMAFFQAYRFLARRSPIRQLDALLVFLLPLAANLLFRLVIRRRQRGAAAAPQIDDWARLASWQLDADLAVLALTVFFSGGLHSPVIALMMLTIVMSTFLAGYRKALNHTVAAMVLLTAIARDLLRQSRELSVSDGLTGLYNQMHFFELLERETGRARRPGGGYTLVIFDVDHFKNFNDRNGHLRGSQTLRAVADLMRRKFRSTDLLAKYGGDEFVVILPGTDKVGAYLAAERLREGVEKQAFPGAETQPLGRLTISIGLASCPEHGAGADEILNHADKALYFAKDTGRNRTVIYHEDIEKEAE